VIETLSTHRTNWRLLRFKAGDPERRQAVKALGFPSSACSCLQQRLQPADQGPDAPRRGVSAIDQEAESLGRRLAVLIADMRAHRNPTRMKVLRALSWKLAKRLERSVPENARRRASGPIESRPRTAVRGLRRRHALDPFEVRRCFGLWHAIAPAAQGRSQDRPEALLRELRRALAGAAKDISQTQPKPPVGGFGRLPSILRAVVHQNRTDPVVVTVKVVGVVMVDFT
jgi:hypothetical protein